jgi:hypothetical protein
MGAPAASNTLPANAVAVGAWVPVVVVLSLPPPPQAINVHAVALAKSPRRRWADSERRSMNKSLKYKFEK